jgi:quercetin 2,3-dioxygenase
MITLSKHKDRHLFQRGNQEIRHTFNPQERRTGVPKNFDMLGAFDEIRLPPNGISASPPLAGFEIVTYIYQGALAQEDSAGISGVIHAGEFQRMIIGHGIRHNEANALRNDFTHLFRISLHPSEVGLDSTHEQKRFMVGQRRNLLCVIASPDGRKKSLRILQNAILYSSILDPGRHLVHELSLGRSAWLHIINGEATMQDIILTEGDGAGITTEPVVSLTATENTELLLIDLGPELRYGPWKEL